MPILDSFKLKGYDLEPVYALWVPPPPSFTGSPTQNVDEWLAVIKAGCTERNVPREYWHKVAQRYMAPKAKARLDELKAVMKQVHGGRYRWNWDKYKIAMRNMGWDIDEKKTETVKVHSKSNGLLWFTRKSDEEKGGVLTEEPLSMNAPPPPPPKPSGPKRSDSKFWLNRKQSTDLLEEPVVVHHQQEDVKPKRPTPQASKSMSGAEFFKSMRRGSTQEIQRPSAHKALSDTVVMTAAAVTAPVSTSSSEVSAPVRSDTVATTQAPVWLINACNALDFLTSEHPKVMSTISAILITAGSIPAIPAVAAGAGGAILASGAAHAVGAIAVGIGSWLKAQQELNNINGNGRPSEASAASIVSVDEPSEKK